jgi:hypothetical protein
VSVSDLMLNLSIFPVGPRHSWDAPPNGQWLFALQVAASYSTEPALDQLPEWAKAMLPWRVLTGVGAAGTPPTTIDLGWQMFRNESPRDQRGRVPARAVGNLDPLPIRRELEARFPHFAGLPEPPRSFLGPSGGTIAEVTESAMLLSPVVQALGGATPQLTSGELRCTWYFSIPVTPQILEEVNNGARRLAAFPVSFFDTRQGSVRFAPGGDGDLFEFANDTLRIRYRRMNENAGKFLVQTLPFELDRLRAPIEPVLSSYWLPATDSRIDSVAEIHSVVADGLALRPRVQYLTPELLTNNGVVRDAAIDRAADARLFAEIARRVFDVDENSVELREKRGRLATALIASALTAAKLPNKTFLPELRAQLVATATTWWLNDAVSAINDRAKSESIIKTDDPGWKTGDATALFGDFGLYVLPARTDVRPLLPGEGIDVLLGDPALRLRHEGPADDTANSSDHAHIAELAVLVRRARTPGELRRRQWHLATSAVVALDLGNQLEGIDRYWGSEIAPPDVVDESIDYHRASVVRGIKSSFQNGLSRTDFTYYGAPLIAENVGSALHGIPGEPDDDMPGFFDELLPLSFQPVGPVAAHVPHSESTLVPPLRYGDFYQFAGFVIDRGGGIPRELVNGGDPPLASSIDWSRLAAGELPALDVNPPIEFLRRVPVGEVNILPPPHPETGKKPQWPPLPSDVVLSSREWLSAMPEMGDVDNVPALLLSAGEGFTRKQPSYQFRVAAPAIDEHTLSRWLMPAAVDPSNEAQVLAATTEREIASEAIAAIHRRRAELLDRRAALLPPVVEWDGEENVLPPDPAVAAIGLRCIFVDRNGASTRQTSFLAPSAVVSVSTGANPSLSDPIVLPPGTFAILELLPLVRAKDFRRFESLAMVELTEAEPWVDDQGEEYVAFRASRILVESASADLPDAKAVYDAFQVSKLDTGAIDVLLRAPTGVPLEHMAFVDRYELARQRWTWRNRPIVVPGGGTQSQLPKELIENQGTRDTALAVLRFDSLAELDRGLVDRGRVGGRVSRKPDGSPLAAASLLIDDRDAVSHADYLRFGVSLISRYRGILHPSRERVTARAADHPEPELLSLEKARLWRRITAPFRGDSTRIKAPKTLAILPLTRGLEHENLTGVSADATPVLIVLDEIWFREYGWGEELSVEIVLETKEIGDADDDERPFRVGPLPDHYVNTHFLEPPFNGKRHFYEDSTDVVQNEQDGKRHKFKVFGPFGHSLDRSGNEAVANATAFIAYAPAEVKSHYAAFIRLRRVLHGQKLHEGPPGGTYAVYTQPDAALLAHEPAGVSIFSDDKYSSEGLELRPTATTPPKAVVDQYRYLLLLGPVFPDFGRGNDLFLPSHAAWLRADGTVAWPGGAAGDRPEARSYRGRVLELLLNGRFDGTSPLETQGASLHDILRRLFVDRGNPEDADAMIRRISGSFPVTIEDRPADEA